MIRRPLGKWLTECLKVWSFDDFVGPRPLDAGGSNAKKLKRFWYTIAENCNSRDPIHMHNVN